MSRSNVWFKWILVFLSFIAVGGGMGYFFMRSLRTDFAQLAPLTVKKQPTVENVKKSFNIPSVPAIDQKSQPKVDLKNPFVIPIQYYKKSGHPLVTSKNRALMEYQGIIETDNKVLGLVKLTTTNETFVVYEGESIVEFGLTIEKITPKTLTYTKDGVEAVISLGGSQH